MVDRFSDTVGVYTAIFGDKDTLREPKNPSSNCVYYCVTDNSRLRSDAHQIILVDRKFKDPTRDARMYKLTPHATLPGSHRYSLWHDANIDLIVPDVGKLVEDSIAGHRLVTFGHHSRRTLKEEVNYNLEKGRDDPEVIRAQYEYYLGQGYRDSPNNRLVETGVLIRETYAPETVVFDNSWWGEVSKRSRRDQLSANYTLWELGWQKGREYDLFASSDIRNSPYTRVIPHQKADAAPERNLVCNM